jgi:hypothetical protein
MSATSPEPHEIEHGLASHAVLPQQRLHQLRAPGERLPAEHPVDEMMERVRAAALECPVIVVRETAEIALCGTHLVRCLLAERHGIWGKL